MDMNDNDEVELIKSRGHNPLADFPHARFHCVSVPIKSHPARQACPNCWCYPCDVPHAKCTKWDEHCVATSEVPEWKHYREQTLFRRKQAKKPPVVSVVAAVIPTQVILIPAGTPHGPHAQHLSDVSYSSTPSFPRTESVRIVSNVRDRIINRFARGKFCLCYTSKNCAQLLTTTRSHSTAALAAPAAPAAPAAAAAAAAAPVPDYDTLDSIYRPVDFHHFVNTKKHSAVSGRGVPFDHHILSDFETCWECKECGLPPPIDIDSTLNRQRKAWLQRGRHVGQ